MRILITGASGQLGAYLIENLSSTNHEIRAWSGRESGHRFGVELRPIDLANKAAVERSLDEAKPDAILHAAAISSAESVRLDLSAARIINVEATRTIAEWADRHARHLTCTSTDLVFDGSRAWNRETDPALPSLAYGRTKIEAEAAVLATPRGVVARIPLLYGFSRCGRPSFFGRAIENIREGVAQSFFQDEFRTPLHYSDAARILVHMIESDLAGLYHVAGAERVSRFELMRRAVQSLGLNEDLVLSSRLADQEFSEPRPADVSLDTTKLSDRLPNLSRPTIEEALQSVTA